MIKKENIKKLMNREYTFADIKDYFLGMYRYKIYYTKLKKVLIRKHILEQIELRIQVMDSDCYMKGSCKLCGCMTTGLQMANKACEKPCYPTMMKKIDWQIFSTKEIFMYDKGTGYTWRYKNKTLIKLEGKR